MAQITEVLLTSETDMKKMPANAKPLIVAAVGDQIKLVVEHAEDAPMAAYEFKYQGINESGDTTGFTCAGGCTFDEGDNFIFTYFKQM